jgi:hypothetical protein
MQCYEVHGLSGSGALQTVFASRSAQRSRPFTTRCCNPRVRRTYSIARKALFLMGMEDAAGSMFGPASMVIPTVKDTSDLRSKGAPGKAAAVAYLAKYPDPYAMQLLEWALDDGNQFVRMEAAQKPGGIRRNSSRACSPA